MSKLIVKYSPIFIILLCFSIMFIYSYHNYNVEIKDILRNEYNGLVIDIYDQNKGTGVNISNKKNQPSYLYIEDFLLPNGYNIEIGDSLYKDKESLQFKFYRNSDTGYYLSFVYDYPETFFP